MVRLFRHIPSSACAQSVAAECLIHACSRAFALLDVPKRKTAAMVLSETEQGNPNDGATSDARHQSAAPKGGAVEMDGLRCHARLIAKRVPETATIARKAEQSLVGPGG